MLFDGMERGASFDVRKDEEERLAMARKCASSPCALFSYSSSRMLLDGGSFQRFCGLSSLIAPESKCKWRDAIVLIKR